MAYMLNTLCLDQLSSWLLGERFDSTQIQNVRETLRAVIPVPKIEGFLWDSDSLEEFWPVELKRTTAVNQSSLTQSKRHND
jgi:hypothetical protein